MTSLHPGDRLDHFRIDSVVAVSGMATIFRATDLRTSQTVAIKVPHFGYAKANEFAWDLARRRIGSSRSILVSPARTVDSIISPELQETIYRSLERNPAHR